MRGHSRSEAPAKPIPAAAVPDAADPSDIVLTLAQRVNERDPVAVECIRRIVNLLGVQRAFTLADQAVRTEAAGGMMTQDGRRKRTTGGIFFHLATRLLSQSERRALHKFQTRLQTEYQLRQKLPRESLMSRKIGRLGSLSVPVSLDVSRAIAQRLDGKAGKAYTMKIRLVGRPGRVEQRDGLVVFQMRDDLQAARLPKVLPPLPDTPQTYVVYLPAKHWVKIFEEMEQQQGVLSIEGVAVFDPRLGKLVVYGQDAFVVPEPAPPKPRQARPPLDQDGSSESKDTHLPLDLAAPSDEVEDVAGRLAQLHSAVKALESRIESIKSMPFSQRRDLPEHMSELHRLKSEIEALEARS